MFMTDLQAVESHVFRGISPTREGSRDSTEILLRENAMCYDDFGICSGGTDQIPTTSMFVDDEERGSVDSNPADRPWNRTSSSSRTASSAHHSWDHTQLIACTN